MATQFVFIGIFVAAAIAYNLWMKKNSARQLVAARPAFKDFFERTGYCYPDPEGSPHFAPWAKFVKLPGISRIFDCFTWHAPPLFPEVRLHLPQA